MQCFTFNCIPISDRHRDCYVYHLDLRGLSRILAINHNLYLYSFFTVFKTGQVLQE